MANVRLLLLHCFVLAALSIQVSSSCTQVFNASQGWMCDRICKEKSVKVRISLKKELGEEAYPWDTAESFFFQSSVAYAMRKSVGSDPGLQVPFEAQHVIICAKTERISFYVAVLNPNGTQVEKEALLRAVRQSRPRMNRAFMLSAQTLEFLGTRSTLAPRRSAFAHAWLVAYAAVTGASLCGMVALFVDACRKRRRDKRSLELETMDKITEGLPTVSSSVIQPNGVTLTAF